LGTEARTEEAFEEGSGDDILARVVRKCVTSYRRDVDGGDFVAMKDELGGKVG
jgi:hypothetical protein